MQCVAQPRVGIVSLKHDKYVTSIYFMPEILLTLAISISYQNANRPRLEKHTQMVEIRLINTEVDSVI